MTRTDLSAEERRTYRRQLQDLRTRLAGEMGQLEDEALHPADGEVRGESMAQEADRPVRAAEEDVARTLLASESGILAEVTAALGRLKDGTFGMCQRCGRPIARARLDTVPYARTCIRCAREGGAAEAP
jgi:RNA polymerase-binding transcription factor DksA